MSRTPHCPVWTKDGRILTYRDPAAAANIDYRSTWVLETIEDRVGNTIRYDYSWGGSLGYRLAWINYTGHGTNVGDREIRFTYDDVDPNRINDPAVGYSQVGEQTAIFSRLSKVETLVQGEVVRTYALTYETAPNGVRRLREIAECAGAGTSQCKAPTTFDYYDEEPGLDLVPAEHLPPGVWLDLNGDGIADLIETDGKIHHGQIPQETLIVDAGLLAGSFFVNPAVGIAASFAWEMAKFMTWGRPSSTLKRTAHLATGVRPALYGSATGRVDDVSGLTCLGHSPGTAYDVDGDGWDDIVEMCQKTRYPGDDLYWELTWARSLGNGHFESRGVLATLENPSRVPDQDLPFYMNFYLLDLNGDGLKDLVHCVDAYTLALRRGLPGGGFSSPESFPDVAYHATCRGYRPNYVHLLDTDGDGATNLVTKNVVSLGHEDDLRYYALGMTDAGPRWQEAFRPVGYLEKTPLASADFNGDGLADLFASSVDLDGRDAPVPVLYQNIGYSLIPQILAVEGQSSSSEVFSVFDFDSDERADVIHFSDGIEASLLRTVNSWEDVITGSWLTKPTNAWTHVTDLDGDGNLDVIALPEGDTTYGWHYYGRGRRTSLLEKVTDGVGNWISVDYNDQEEGKPTYTRSGGACSWPQRCIKRLSSLVSRHTIGRPGTGGAWDRTYVHRYYDARMDDGGHGWLGFQSREVEEFVPGTAGAERRSRTLIEYKAPVTTTLQGTAVDPATGGAYIYPFAGLPERVLVESAAVGGGISDQARQRLLYTDTTWALKLSQGGTVFPYVQSRITSEWDLPPGTAPSGSPVWRFDELMEVDEFGNVTHHQTRGLTNDIVESVATEYNFNQTDIDLWLIAQPDSRTVNSSRGGNSLSQQFVYDHEVATGLLRMAKRAPDDPERELATFFYYDDYGNVELVWESGRNTSFTYDAAGVFPLTATNHLNHTTHLRFDRRHGTLIARVDPNGISEQWAYDGFGRPTSEQGPDGATIVTHAFPPAGELVIKDEVTVERTDGSRVAYGVDSRGQVQSVRRLGFGGAQIIETFGYDPLGRLTTATRPHLEFDTTQGSTSYQYDALDRLVRVTNPDQTYRTYEYASVDGLRSNLSAWTASLQHAAEVVWARDEGFHATVSVHDHRGNLLRTVDALNVNETDPNTTDLVYGPFNALSSFTDNLGNTTNIIRDAYGRPETLTDPDTGTWTYGYNRFDELELIRDPSQVETTFVYDQLGRLAYRFSVEQEGGSPVQTHWVYDGPGPNEIGRLVWTITPPSLGNPNGHQVRYGYEPPSSSMNRGLLETVTHDIDQGGPDLVTRVEYDAASRVQTVHYPAPDGIDFAIRYDYQGAYLSQVSDVSSGSPEMIWQLTSADQGYRIGTESFGLTGASTTYGYEPLTGNIATMLTTAGGQQVQRLEYDYLNTGHVSSMSRSQENPSDVTSDFYDYDDLYRLEGVDHLDGSAPSDFNYDQVGNVTYKSDLGTYSYYAGKPHLVEHAGSHSYTYDARGNMTGRVGPKVPFGGQQIHYTSFDLPRWIESGTPAVRSTYFEYDASQTRVMKWTETDETLYAGELYRKITPADITESPEHRYAIFVGGRQMAEVVRFEGSSTASAKYTLYSDRLGSPTLLSDSTTVFPHEFAPFGEAGYAEFTATGVTTGFTGHRHDAELGLIDMRGRVYDPVAARFLSADPVANVATSQGMNPYSYVENSPTNYVDPSGFIPQLFAADEGLAFGVLGWAGIVGGATLATVVPGLSLGGGIAGTLGRLPGIGGAFASGPRTESFGTPGTSAPASMAATGRAQYDATSQAKGGPPQAGSDLYNEVEPPPGGGTDERLAMLPRPDCQKSPDHPQCDPMFAADIVMLPSGAVLRGARAAAVFVYRGGAWLVKRILSKGAAKAIPKIHMGRQGKHILGHRNFIPGRSVLRADPVKLAQKAGTGTPVGKVPRGQPGFKERVDFREVIGDYVDEATGAASPTTKGIIHHSKEGIHIVPAAP